MKSGHHHPQHPNDWHYGNQGTDWDHHKVELKQFQSPIDLPINQLMLMEAGNKLDTEIQFSYDAVPESYYIDHRLHRSIQVSVNQSSSSDVLSMGQIVVDGKIFKVDQFHFHAPAEHLFDGIREALELHIVHKFYGYATDQVSSEDSSNSSQKENLSSLGMTKVSSQHMIPHEDQLVVVGITFTASPNQSNPFLEALLSIKDFPFAPGAQLTCSRRRKLNPTSDGQNERPDQTEGQNERPDLDLSSLLFSDDLSNVNLVRYFGSLTTPPLHEVVHWFVRSTPIQASSKQLEMLMLSMKYPGTDGNYRCCNGRQGRPRVTTDPSDSSQESNCHRYVWMINGQRYHSAMDGN